MKLVSKSFNFISFFMIVLTTCFFSLSPYTLFNQLLISKEASWDFDQDYVELKINLCGILPSYKCEVFWSINMAYLSIHLFSLISLNNVLDFQHTKSWTLSNVFLTILLFWCYCKGSFINFMFELFGCQFTKNIDVIFFILAEQVCSN